MENSNRSMSQQRRSVPTIPTSVKESCFVCGKARPDLTCACGGKYHLSCIGDHAQQIHFEFEFIQNKIGEQFLDIEQVVRDQTCQNAKTMVENWKRKRLQEINDIADNVFNQIAQREIAQTEVSSLKAQFDELCQGAHYVVHQQLDSLVELQGRVRDVSGQLNALPQLVVYDYADLDAALQSKLNPAGVCLKSPVEQVFSSIMTNGDSGIHSKIESVNHHSHADPFIDAASLITTTTIESTSDPFGYIEKMVPALPNAVSTEHSVTNTEGVISRLTSESNADSIVDNEHMASISTNPPIAQLSVSSEPLVFTSTLSHDGSLTSNVESPVQTSPASFNDTNVEEFDIGETDRILRRNITRIPTTDDKHVATIACHGNELFYNDFNPRTRKARLTFIRDFTRPTEKEIIAWPEPEALVGGGDDDWVQDIAYCSSLKGYLLLNRSRVRLLCDETHQIEEFHQFPDRSMKRVTCNDSFIYLIVAGGVTSPHGDEILLMNYQKEEKIVKTFRDIIVRRTMRPTASLVGEISDIAVNNSGQMIFSYRCERQQEVGVCVYNISSDGLKWNNIRGLILNECWHLDLSYTPRIEWCEKLNRFILIEFQTSHLILLDSNGQVKGERLFLSGDHGGDSPLNLSISDRDCLAIRYDSFINLHRLV